MREAAGLHRSSVISTVACKFVADFASNDDRSIGEILFVVCLTCSGCGLSFPQPLECRNTRLDQAVRQTGKCPSSRPYWGALGLVGA